MNFKDKIAKNIREKIEGILNFISSYSDYYYKFKGKIELRNKIDRHVDRDNLLTHDFRWAGADFYGNEVLFMPGLHTIRCTRCYLYTTTQIEAKNYPSCDGVLQAVFGNHDYEMVEDTLESAFVKFDLACSKCNKQKIFAPVPANKPLVADDDCDERIMNQALK